MSVCLGIDGSGHESSAAVAVDGVLVSDERAPSRASGEVLLSLTKAALKRAGTALADVSAISVGIGPGSFTGIRNGIATVQGLAVATRLNSPALPVFGVSALLAYGFGAMKTGERVFVFFPANRQESFCAMFESANADGKAKVEISVLTGALIVTQGDESQLALDLQQQLLGRGLGDKKIVHAACGVIEQGESLAALNARIAAADILVLESSSGENPHLLFQKSERARGLLPLYAKPVHAKTLVERGLATG